MILDKIIYLLEFDKQHIDSGKMHQLLDIPLNTKIIDVYKTGDELAKNLINALNGNINKAFKMLLFAANIDKRNNVFDDAVRYIKTILQNNKNNI